MTKILFTLALAMPLSAFALNGQAKLSIGNTAGYDITLNDVVVEGETQTIGQGNGRTKLVYANGAWSGNFGMTGITASAPKTDSKGHTTFTIQTLPGGVYTFHVEADKKTVNVSVVTPFGLGSVSAKLDNSSVDGGHEYASMELNQVKPNYMSGSLFIQDGEFGQHEYVDLHSTDDLQPGSLAVKDPVLFAILYFMPYSYSR